MCRTFLSFRTIFALVIFVSTFGCGRADGPKRESYSVEGFGEWDAEIIEEEKFFKTSSESGLVLNKSDLEACFFKEQPYFPLSHGLVFYGPADDLCKISNFELNFEGLAMQLDEPDFNPVLGAELLPGDAFTITGRLRLDRWAASSELDDEVLVSEEWVPVHGIFRVLSFTPQTERYSENVNATGRIFMSGKLLFDDISTECGTLRVTGHYDFYLVQNYEST